MRPSRTLIFRLSLCLVLGAVTTWLVAAGFAVWGLKQPTRHHASLDPSIPIASSVPTVLRLRKVALGFESRVAIAYDPELDGSVHGYMEMIRIVRSSDSDLPALSRWGRWPAITNAQLFANRGRLSEEGFGWPRLSFWYPVAPYDPKGDFSGHGGIDLQPLTSNTQHWNRAIPLLPIWPGLLIDTGFYSLLWAVPIIGLPMLRVRRRRRKGRCPKCAYDLQHAFKTGCPECGWQRSQAI
jgi:hypothetical protein